MSAFPSRTETLTPEELDTFKDASDAMHDAWRKMDDVMDLCFEKRNQINSGIWPDRYREARKLKTELRELNERLARLTQ